MGSVRCDHSRTGLKIERFIMNLNESTVTHLWRILHGLVSSIKTIGIVTAQNPQIGYKYDETSPVANEVHNSRRNEWLKKIVRKDGYGYIPIIGRYGNLENPILIQNISRDRMIEYCRMFGQESVIWGDVSNTANLMFELIYADNMDRNRIRHVFTKLDRKIEPLPQIKDVLDSHGYEIENYNDGIVVKDNRKERMGEVLFRIDSELADLFEKDVRRVTDYYSEYKGTKFQIPFFDDTMDDPDDTDVPKRQIPNPNSTIGRKFIHRKMPDGLDRTVIENKFDKAYDGVVKKLDSSD